MAGSEEKEVKSIRKFETGATRDSEEGKFDYEGFLHPIVMERYGEYMDKHSKQANGELRDSDNWQKGIPKRAYMKSGFRHFHAWWKEHRGYPTKDGIEEAICALIFNASGYLLERLRAVEEEKKLLESVERVITDSPYALPIDNDSPFRRHAMAQAGMQNAFSGNLANVLGNLGKCSGPLPGNNVTAVQTEDKTLFITNPETPQTYTQKLRQFFKSGKS